ncbi:MAG: hypothetical protein M3680_25965, partial [Myxococcota bacterium]|nr:hypothetical protein [Myxococcota bacterium]
LGPGADARPFPLTTRQLAMAGGGLVAVIIALAVIFGGKPDAPVAAPADAGIARPEHPEITMDPSDPVADVLSRANQFIANGRREAAIDLLISARKTFPGDARLAYLTGKLFFDKLWWTDGLRHLKDAVRLDPQLRSDPDLIKMVLKGFITTPRYDAPLAGFLRTQIGEAAKPYLEDTAKHHPNAAKRSRAASELAKY